ncbi:MAG: MraZ protein [Planctomycetota bacterium]|jgi:MraZ protein
MFFGNSEHPLDGKFRVFVPKRFQDEIERDEKGNIVMMLTPGKDGCLFLFSVNGFMESLGDVDTRAFTSEAERVKQRSLFYAATKVTLDASGRLLLSEQQREMIDLQKNGDGKIIVKMVGVMQRAEIWPLHAWLNHEKKIKEAERSEEARANSDARGNCEEGGR